jgi:hypothetical protein
MTEPEIVDAMLVMERLRAEFRRRRGDLPPSGRSEPERRLDRVHLKQIESLGRLTEVPVPRSHRKRVGNLVMAARRALWKLLAPIVRQQGDVNAATAALLAGLTADRDELLAEQRSLLSRMEALEARLAKIEDST